MWNFFFLLDGGFFRLVFLMWNRHNILLIFFLHKEIFRAEDLRILRQSSKGSSYQYFKLLFKKFLQRGQWWVRDLLCFRTLISFSLDMLSAGDEHSISKDPSRKILVGGDFRI